MGTNNIIYITCVILYYSYRYTVIIYFLVGVFKFVIL